MTDVFGPYGYFGVALLVFFMFLLDALAVPTLPELFFIIGFMFDPTWEWGLVLLAVASVAEVMGVSILYYIVEHIRVPEKIKHIAGKYVNFLIVNDERILLVNRMAPMIPFAGAFISIIDSWQLKKAVLYIVAGCILKYGAILLMSSFFYTFFSGSMAQTFTLVFIFSVLGVSMAASFYKKKKSGVSS